MKLVIIGAGGFGREAAWAAETSGYEIAGICDDDPGAAPRCAGRTFLGTLEDAVREGRVLVSDTFFFVAIGKNAVRRALFERAVACGLRPASVISPNALVAPDAVVGEGSYAGPGCVISVGTRLGRGVIVNNLASVGHDVTIGDFAQICPGVAISGGCTIGEEALLGTNATVIPLKRIGEEATLGAGALALRDIADGESIVRLR
jgi:sugar O-acyltransferase (sialic acid O-acetyltransferase NeuD family)